MTREELIRSLFKKESRGLEIGPSYNPIAPKRLGYNVEILDHASTEDLRAKYRNESNVDFKMIEEVDYVWSNRSLSETIGSTGIYDYIVASHVIEHTPDILGFLKECSKLLTSTGRLILAAPDMRRCFDYFRPLTSLGPVLQAHAEKRSRHSPATACDHVAYMAYLDGVGGWGNGVAGRLTAAHSLEFSVQLFDRSMNDSAYYDFHAWVFTPSSFRLLISDLNSIGELDISEANFIPTDGFEFIVVLSRSGANDIPSRIDLLNEMKAELMEIHSFPLNNSEK